MKVGQIWETLPTCFCHNGRDWKLVPGSFTILIKWKHSKIRPFLIVGIYHFSLSLAYYLSQKMKHWNLDITGYWVTEAGFYIEEVLELSQSPPNCSKDSWKIFFLLTSTNWPSLVRVVLQKIYSQMHPVSHTNTYHDTTNLINKGIFKNKEKIE